MTRITIDEKNKQRLAKIGHKGSTWTSILDDILDHIETCNVFWSERK